MTICKPLGVFNDKRFAHGKHVAAYSTMPLADKHHRAEFVGPIDPCLLGDVSHLEYSQNNWAATQMSSFKESPAEPSLDGHLTHTQCDGSVPEVVSYPQPPVYGRHESPFSIQNSPCYTFAPSPSIGSEGYYDALHAPATPPDAPGPFFFLLGRPYDAGLGCLRDNAYVDVSHCSPGQASHSDDVLPVADPTSFGVNIGIGIGNPDPYHPTLMPGPLGTDGRQVAAGERIDGQHSSGSLPCHDSSRKGTSEETVDVTVPHGAPLSEAKSLGRQGTLVEGTSPTKRALRPERNPRHLAAEVVRKRASSDVAISPNGEKKRKLLPTGPKLCLKCKSSFRDRNSLDEHMEAKHYRPYVCVFHYAGCTARFDAKNEWKRHVSTKHLGLKYWLCEEGSCATATGPSAYQRSPSLPEFGNIFNRKDLYTQHIRRMHAAVTGQNLLDYKRCTAESNERLRRMQTAAMRVRCQLPKYMPCPVEACNKKFMGHTTWEDWMEHVAQKHFENAAAGREPPVEFGGPNDTVLTSWAAQDDVQIVKQTATGWELCDPLKGDGGIKRTRTGTSEEDAEGEEQL